MKSHTINLSKIDAAKRQLDMSIILYFSNADPVSIHTLAAASHGIINDLSKPIGVKSFIKNFDLIRDEKRGEYIKLINSAQNFFKHADKDENELYNFTPSTTDFLIFDACQLYQQLTNEAPKLMHIFSIWFYLNEPDIIRDDMQAEKIMLEENRSSFNLQNRADFFQKISKEYDAINQHKFTLKNSANYV